VSAPIGLDLSKTGSNDIVVGREDGSLELYDMDEQGGLQQVGGWVSDMLGELFLTGGGTSLCMYTPG
jgi:hypothetical protein